MCIYYGPIDLYFSEIQYFFVCNISFSLVKRFFLLNFSGDVNSEVSTAGARKAEQV